MIVFFNISFFFSRNAQQLANRNNEAIEIIEEVEQQLNIIIGDQVPDNLIANAVSPLPEEVRMNLWDPMVDDAWVDNPDHFYETGPKFPESRTYEFTSILWAPLPRKISANAIRARLRLLTGEDSDILKVTVNFFAIGWVAHIEFKYRRYAYAISRMEGLAVEGETINFQINRMLKPREMYYYWRY